MAAGLGADGSERAHLRTVLAHVLAPGTAEGDQVARDFTGIAAQLILDRQVFATRQRTVVEIGAGRAWTHLLKPYRQSALDLTALHRGTGQVKGARAGGAGVVDVEHRNRSAPDPVQRRLTAGGIAIDVTGEGHLHLVVVKAGIGQRQAHGLGPHVDVAGTVAWFTERDHADPGYEYMFTHGDVLNGGSIEGGVTSPQR
ncbi:hypothetical protein D3C78_1338120 [compost metagenome]